MIPSKQNQEPSEIHKAEEEFRWGLSHLINNSLDSKNVVNGLIISSKDLFVP